MRKIYLGALALTTTLILCSCCQIAAPTPALSLNNKSRYQIVLPDQASNPGTLRHLRVGAEMLQRSFRALLGVEMPICAEKQAQLGVPALYIGATRAAQRVGIDAKKYPNFAYTLQVHGSNIFIVGCDDHNFKNPKGRGEILNYTLGSFNGMVNFAEKYLGTRFLYPGRWGHDWPSRQKELRLPGDLHEEVFPPLILSRGRGQNDPFYNYSNVSYGGGSSFSYGGHSYYDAVPKQKYAKSHPEYFALVGSKRDSTNNHLCISNPEVQELIYQEMVRRIKLGADTVQLAQTDGYMQCQCDNCRKFANTTDPAEKLWFLHLNLARRLAKEYPGKNAHIIAYYPTQNPPKNIKKFPKNVIVELCRYSPEEFKTWSQVEVPGGFTVYVYNWGGYNVPGMTPQMTPMRCARQVQLFCQNQVRGLYRCGFGENFGLEGPAYYVFGKMFADPTQDYRQVLEDFYHRAYHKAYSPMRSFHENLFRRLEIYQQTSNGFLTNSPDFVQLTNPRVLLSAIYSPDLLELLERDLSNAEELAKGDIAVEKRLQLVRFNFNYVKNLGQILHLYNAYRTMPDKYSFERLAKLIDERNAMLDSCYRPNGQAKNVPDWPFRYFANMKRSSIATNGRLLGVLSSPLSWNTKMLRQKGVLPGVGKKVARVYPAKGEISTSHFDAGAWKVAPYQNLSGIQLGETKSKTRFKALYTAQELLLGIETDLPRDRKYLAIGQDGIFWRQDCLELMIDPLGNRETFYHFGINPIENSCYDASFGLIKNPLSPLFDKGDTSWNGKWSYTTTRRGDKWYLLVKIPFATLKVAAPHHGTVWRMNLGREDFVTRRHLELSLWSPNLETMSFLDRDTFGELVFE